MWNRMYTMPESLDTAMGLIKHKVLDIGKQKGNVVDCLSLPKQTAFLACEENLAKMKETLAALEVWQDPEDSE